MNDIMYEYWDLLSHQQCIHHEETERKKKKKEKRKWSISTNPLGRLPRDRINCSSRNAKYKYFMTVLRIGVAVLPNGKARSSFDGPGVPTRSMITEVVSQYEAIASILVMNSKLL